MYVIRISVQSFKALPEITQRYYNIDWVWLFLVVGQAWRIGYGFSVHVPSSGLRVSLFKELTSLESINKVCYSKFVHVPCVKTKVILNVCVTKILFSNIVSGYLFIRNLPV